MRRQLDPGSGSGPGPGSGGTAPVPGQAPALEPATGSAGTARSGTGSAPVLEPGPVQLILVQAPVLAHSGTGAGLGGHVLLV